MPKKKAGEKRGKGQGGRKCHAPFPFRFRTSCSESCETGSGSFLPAPVRAGVAQVIFPRCELARIFQFSCRDPGAQNSQPGMALLLPFSTVHANLRKAQG